MDQLIKFRHFASSISQHEFESLMPEISGIIGKDVLVSLLYEYFSSKRNNPENNGHEQIKQINHRIAAVVNKNTSSTQPKLDKISQPLINKICSYLDIESYTIFERCNRMIFIAARSPLQLYYTNSFYASKYIKYCNENNQTVDNNRFGRVKSFDIFGYLPNYSSAHLVLDNLQNLSIFFSDKYEQKLTAIIQSKDIKLIKLKELTLRQLTWPTNTLFNHILGKASNLKFLNLSYPNVAPTLYKFSQSIIKNLSGLSLQFDEDYDADRNVQFLVSAEKDIINLCSSELKSFHTASELTQINVNHTKFPNLIELCLQDNFDPNVIEIISKFKHLKRLRFDLSDYYFHIELDTKFVNGLLSLHELESISFGYVSGARVGKLLKLIQNALMIHRKKKLKIYIYCVGNYDESICNDMHVDLEVFVNSLYFLIFEDFMFIFFADEIPRSEDEKIEKWLKSLDDERFWWIYESLLSGYLIVGNTGCKINTWQKEWIMECECCKRVKY